MALVFRPTPTQVELASIDGHLRRHVYRLRTAALTEKERATVHAVIDTLLTARHRVVQTAQDRNTCRDMETQL